MYPSKIVVIIIAMAMTMSACTPKPAPVSPEPAVLRVMTHDSFSLSEEIVRDFEQKNNLKLEFIKSGDTGSALNRAILTKAAPQADVFYGVDNTYLSRALKEGIFEPYVSPILADIPSPYKLDSENRALPVDYGDVCINYDKAYFADKNLPLPESLADLTKSTYKGLLVVENPATSSPGMAFLLATIASYGMDGYLDYWQALKENGLVIVNDWETAYYTNFSASSGKGPQSLVVSYASSPAAEVVFAETKLTESPTASLVGKDMCFRQIEFIGILAGTKNRPLAEKFIDAMMDVAIQEDIPMQMFVYPVNQKAAVPEEFIQFSQVPDQPASLEPEFIDQNREAILQAWTEAILK
jgi:thiamine transport system substrate-binding protein